jgi:hypothetical protein
VVSPVKFPKPTAFAGFFLQKVTANNRADVGAQHERLKSMYATKKIDKVLSENSHLFQSDAQKKRVRDVLIECVETKYIYAVDAEIKEAMREQINLMVWNGDYQRLAA